MAAVIDTGIITSYSIIPLGVGRLTRSLLNALNFPIPRNLKDRINEIIDV